MTSANDNRPKWFDALLLQYEPFMRKKCSDLAMGLDPDDVYQEAVIICIRRWRSLRSDGSFVAWSAYLCREAARNLRRGEEKHRHEDLAESAIAPTQDFGPEAEMMLRPCTPKQREAMELSMAGYDYTEIGAMMGLTKQGAQLRILAGREKIKVRIRQADAVAELVAVQRAANDNVKARNAAA